jgi:hypothetical protein
MCRYVNQFIVLNNESIADTIVNQERMESMIRTICRSALLACTLTSSIALALDAGAESVENYSGCGCSSGNLRYTHDQASRFIDRIDNWHTRKFWFADGNAWNSDLVEMDLNVGGTDDYYGDGVHILFISGHGGYSGGYYYGYLCKSAGYNSCSYSTSRTYLGENAGQAYSTNTGKLRFLILATCHSVEKSSASSEWGPVFWRGKDLMYVMGYSGTSEDSENTDEVGEEFAQYAAGDKKTLKQSWFDAAREAFSSDVPALITHGTSQADANSRRDNMKLSWTPTGNSPSWVAWSWKD